MRTLRGKSDDVSSPASGSSSPSPGKVTRVQAKKRDGGAGSPAPAGPAAEAGGTAPAGQGQAGAQGPDAAGGGQEQEMRGHFEEILPEQERPRPGGEGAEDRKLDTAGAAGAGVVARPEGGQGGAIRFQPDFTIVHEAPQRDDHVCDEKCDHAINPWLIGTTHSAPQSHPAPPFGEELYEPSFQSTDYFIHEGTCYVQGTLRVKTPWGVSSGGKTDVPSANASLITASNYTDIADDLKPNAIGKPKRDRYWSQAITSRHERFHGTDDYGWTTSTGWPAARAQLATKTVREPRLWGFMDGNTKADIRAKLQEAINYLTTECWQYYLGGGSAHADRAGELRAYADGKASYQALSDGVKAHGESLGGGGGGGGGGAPGSPAPADGGGGARGSGGTGGGGGTGGAGAHDAP
jgi:hypothetical protein